MTNKLKNIKHYFFTFFSYFTFILKTFLILNISANILCIGYITYNIEHYHISLNTMVSSICNANFFFYSSVLLHLLFNVFILMCVIGYFKINKHKIIYFIFLFVLLGIIGIRNTNMLFTTYDVLTSYSNNFVHLHLLSPETADNVDVITTSENTSMKKLITSIVTVAILLFISYHISTPYIESIKNNVNTNSSSVDMSNITRGVGAVLPTQPNIAAGTSAVVPPRTNTNQTNVVAQPQHVVDTPTWDTPTHSNITHTNVAAQPQDVTEVQKWETSTRTIPQTQNGDGPIESTGAETKTVTCTVYDNNTTDLTHKDLHMHVIDLSTTSSEVGTINDNIPQTYANANIFTDTVNVIRSDDILTRSNAGTNVQHETVPFAPRIIIDNPDIRTEVIRITTPVELPSIYRDGAFFLNGTECPLIMDEEPVFTVEEQNVVPLVPVEEQHSVPRIPIVEQTRISRIEGDPETRQLIMSLVDAAKKTYGNRVIPNDQVLINAIFTAYVKLSDEKQRELLHRLSDLSSEIQKIREIEDWLLLNREFLVSLTGMNSSLQFRFLENPSNERCVWKLIEEFRKMVNNLEDDPLDRNTSVLSALKANFMHDLSKIKIDNSLPASISAINLLKNLITFEVIKTDEDGNHEALYSGYFSSTYAFEALDVLLVDFLRIDLEQLEGYISHRYRYNVYDVFLEDTDAYNAFLAFMHFFVFFD